MSLLSQLFAICHLEVRFRRHWIAPLLVLITVGTVQAQLRLPSLKTKSGATTSRQAREEAIRAIPFERLNDKVNKRIRSVVAKPTIYRRLPQHSMRCDPKLHVFLIRNPEVVVGIWDAMGATQIDLARTGPFTHTATDGAGTSSDIELVYGTQGLHIYYGDGLYEGTLLKNRLQGRAVLVLRSQYQRDRQGRPIVTSVLDLFLDLDNVTADAIARTFHPIVGHFADLNFQETAEFVGRLSEAANQNGAAIQRMATRLKTVPPDVRRQFATVAGGVANNVIPAGHATELPVNRPGEPTTTRRRTRVRPTSAEVDGTE